MFVPGENQEIAKPEVETMMTSRVCVVYSTTKW